MATLLSDGSTVFVWSFAPDWRRAVLERFEWLTDVMVSHNGTEQRVSLRQLPKRTIEFGYAIDQAEDRRKLESLLYGWGSRVWLLPLWHQGQPLTANVSQGATHLFMDRAPVDFEIGRNLVIYRGTFEFEIVQVSDIETWPEVDPTGYRFTLSGGTASAWAADTQVYPAVIAYLDPQNRLARFTGDVLMGVARMYVQESRAAPAYTPTLYRDLPVLTEPAVWLEDLTATYLRKLSEIDFRTGPYLRDDESGSPFVITAHHWRAIGKAATDELLGLFHTVKGRHKTVWLPTFTNDVQIAGAIGNGQGYVDVTPTYTNLLLEGKPGRRDIRIEAVTGEVYYRRITSITEQANGNERLALDSVIPQAITVANVRRMSWLVPARLDADAVEFAWHWDTLADVSVNWRSVNDV